MIRPRSFNIRNWYWFIGADQARLWSSMAGAYVPADDQAYVAWSRGSRRASTVASEQELSELLAKYGIIGPAVLHSFINAERDRRVASGFMFNGHLFQSRVEDQKRINGAVTMAILALSAGAQPGDLHWHGGAEEFGWIAADNTLVNMDAITVVEFGKVAGQWESAHVFAGRALKDMQPIPLDFADGQYWP